MSTRRKKVDKDAIRRKRAITLELYLPADEAQQERFESAKQRRGLAVFTGDEEAIAKADAELEAVKQAIEDEGLVLTFKALGRRRFDEIVNEHPVTDEQREADKDKPEAERFSYNPDTFWPALLAETVVSDLSPEEWREEVLESPEWNGAEVKLVKDHALAVNSQTRVAELGN